VATQRARGSNSAHHPILEAPAPHRGGAFDLDGGSIRGTPKTVVALMVGMFVIGGGVALMHYRMGSVEAAVSRMPDLIEERINQASVETEQRRKIECLQQQIANKDWRCPDAVKAAEPVRRAVLAKAKAPEPAGFQWPWSQSK
jgi:hypothetical protein